MPKKPKESKEFKIKTFVDSLTGEQWENIESLAGRKLTIKRICTLLSKTFRKPIKVSSRKGKARNLQNWVAQWFSFITQLNCGPDEDIAPREMGQPGTDIRLSPKAKSMIPWSVEAKDDQQLSIKNAVAQAKKNMYPETDWIIFAKQTDPLKENRMETIAILDAEKMMKILHKLHGVPAPLRRRQK